jgi:hypothetical protein
MKHILGFVTLLGLASGAAAQAIEITGFVEKLSAPSACSPRATHRVRCTDIHLVAAASVNLAQFEGKVADLKGSLVLAVCPTLEVSEGVNAPYTYRITSSGSGQFKLGETASFRTTAPLLSAVPFVLAGGPGFVPLLQYGSFELDLLSTVYFEVNVALLGSTTVRIPIPSDRNLIGAQIWGQGIYLNLLSNPISGRMLNADCFKITSN